MIKFYLLTLAFSATMSAMAITPFSVRNEQSEAPIKLEQQTAALQHEPLREAGTRNVEETWKTLGEGTYSDAFFSNKYTGYTNDPVTVTVEESEQTPGRYRIVNPWPSLTGSSDKYLIVDATDPEFVLVPEQRSPIYDQSDGETWIASLSQVAVSEYNYTKEQFLNEYGKYNITMSELVIHFPGGCESFMWPNATSGMVSPDVWMSGSTEFDGYLVLPGGELKVEWESVGNGTFYDGHLSSFFTNLTAEECEVNVMQNVDNPNLIKIVKPYAYVSASSNDLVLDIANPENVVIDVQSTGIQINKYGTLYLLAAVTNFSSYEAMVAAGYGHRAIKLEDKKINIPGDGMFLYFPEYDPQKLYLSSNPQSSYLNLPASFEYEFNAITEVGEETDAPPLYYNLQGIRVENPARGQIVICNQTGKTYKMIVK